MDDLVNLHNEGLIHDDICGFNTLFDEENNGACSIDFGFGCKAGVVRDPNGFQVYDRKNAGMEETTSGSPPRVEVNQTASIIFLIKHGIE